MLKSETQQTDGRKLGLYNAEETKGSLWTTAQETSFTYTTIPVFGLQSVTLSVGTASTNWGGGGDACLYIGHDAGSVCKLYLHARISHGERAVKKEM